MDYCILIEGSDIVFLCVEGEIVFDVVECVGYLVLYLCCKGVCLICEGGLVVGSGCLLV